jgi:hypothetical protein
MGTDATTLGPVGISTPKEEYNEIPRCYGMYVPQKYLHMLLEACLTLTPKAALHKVVMEATSQGGSDILKSLIDWFWVMVMQMHAAEMASSSVAQASPPEVALMEPQMLHIYSSKARSQPKSYKY